MKKKRFYEGDIFRFDIDGDRHSYGQIVCVPNNDLKWFAIFDIATDKDLKLEEIVNSNILILAQSMDAKLENEDWKILGRHPVLKKRIKFPLFKVHSASRGWLIQNHKGEFKKPVNEDEIGNAKKKKSFSPAALEYAIKAHLGLVEHKEFCDEIILPSSAGISLDK